MRPVPAVILVVMAVAVFGLLCGCGSSGDTMSDLEKGNLAFARRDYFTAADILKKAHAKNPDNLALITRLGECYVKMGRPERALVFFEKAGVKAPDDVDIQIRLAQLYLLTWQFNQAKKICGMLEEKQTIHPGYYLLKGDISVLDGYPELAESYYRDAVIQSKDALRALMKLAIFLKSVDREKEAARLLDIVEKNPTPAPGILLLLADYHLLDNDVDRAQTYLQEAVAREPEDLGLRYHLVQFYLAAGKNVRAQTLLEALVKKQEDVFLWMALADVYLMTGQMDKARDLFDRLKKAGSDKLAQFELLQGKYWLYAGKPVFAAAHLETALELQPGLVNTRYLLGLTHLLNGKIKLAENKLVQTLHLEPDHHDALVRMGQLLYKKKEYRLSINYLNIFVTAYPEDMSGYLLKGLNLLGLTDYAGAMDQFTLALAVTADTHVPLYYLGLASELSRNYTRALGHYKAAFDLRPGLVDVCYRYHLMLVKTGRNRLVQDHVGNVLASDDLTPLQYYTAASLAGQMDRLPQQIALLEKAIEKDTGFGAGYIALAKALRKNNQFNRSIKILQACTQENPGYEDAWMALARYRLEGQDLKAALAILEQAHEKLQGSPVFLSNLAWLLLENNNDVDKAFNLAQTAYERLPDHIAIADTLGWAYYHKGIYSQAAWLFADIMQKAPENAMVRFHLGMTCYRQGDIDKAVHHLQTAKKAGLARDHMQTIDAILADLKKLDQTTADTSGQTAAEAMLTFPEEPDNDPDIIPLEVN